MEGLRIIEEFITIEDENPIVARICDHEWNGELARRTQHYGYTYPYRRGHKSLVATEPIPAFMLLPDLPFTPDQVIVNEYAPGQGISAHTDHETLFGPVICSLSLGSDCMMDFTRGQERHSVHLKRRSLLIMSGEARYEWKHSIAARRSDPGIGPRSTRVSLTYRTVL